MGSFIQFLEDHPAAIGLAIAAVAVLAYFSRNTATGPQFVGGGNAPAAMDPNAAAVQEANIQAGTTNVGFLASLIGGVRQTDAQLALGAQESSDALTLGLTQSNNTAAVTNNQTSANLTAALAGTAASAQVASQQIAEQQTVGLAQVNQATIAAQINAATAAAITKANADAEAARLAQEHAIARAQDNTTLLGKVIDGASTVLGWIFGSHNTATPTTVIYGAPPRSA